MLFTEKDLVNAFKQNVDNKGWIYFVGNPESNAKFIIDCMKANKEEISEEELDELAEEEYPYEYHTSLYGDKECEYKNGLREAFKAGYQKAKEKLK